MTVPDSDTSGVDAASLPAFAPMATDAWTLGGVALMNRMVLGTALYPTLQSLQDSVRASGVGMVTVSLRRQMGGGGDNRFWQAVRDLGVAVLPNTAGCYTARDAIVTAQMAREVFDTPLVKLEVIGKGDLLQPHPFELVDAARELVRDGFTVLPYCTDDLVLCEALVEAGCEVLMPWGSPIGSGKGLVNPYGLELVRKRFPDRTLLVDAGLGTPSDAARALELGYDGVLLNSAVALAQDPPAMARAFALAVQAGRVGFTAGRMPERELASPSTPTVGVPFWHRDD